MNKAKLKESLIGLAKDLLTAFVIVAIVMLVLFAYCRIWPPMVVVESGSMQRYDDRSVVGVIDTGDMVFVKKVGGTDDLVTYVDGEATGYSRYGGYGDVVIYKPNGLSERPDGSQVVPIIHRLVMWIDVNATAVDPEHDGIDYGNYTFDVPSLGLYGTTDNVEIPNYGFWDETVTILLDDSYGGLLNYFHQLDMVPHGGYVTMGDHNVPTYDQQSYELVKPEWIVGKAWGEMPWFGLVKLKVTGADLQGAPANSWTNLIATLVIVLTVPLVLDMILPRLRKRRRGKGDSTDGSDGERVGKEPVGAGNGGAVAAPAEPGDVPAQPAGSARQIAPGHDGDAVPPPSEREK